jgi:protein dithiol:quinone oxidoreductase
MFDKLNSIARSRLYWLLLLVLCMVLEGVALFFQHVMNEWPCVLCIHVRILLMFMMLVAIIALLLMRYEKILALMHFLVACLSVAMLERSWVLLATERGWIEGECSIDMGMPAWFAIDKWLPSMFSAWTSCGYTPVIAFGITMAEMLLVLSIILLITSAVLFVSVIRKSR